MTETYCGKSCADCTQKDALNCPDCQTGPGRPFYGDCELAECCRKKGHDSCDTCNFQENCSTFHNREHQPDYRKNNIEMQQIQKEALAKNAPILGKWLGILFWLLLLANIARITGNNYTKNISPDIYLTGNVLTIICSIIYYAILYKLFAVENKYRTAALCGLAAMAVSAAIFIYYGTTEVPAESLLITLPMTIVSLVGEYKEYLAHSSVLADVDSELSKKWLTLWKCYVGALLSAVGGLFLILLIPFLGIILLLGAAVALLATSVARLVYLYKTAKNFRNYHAET